SRIRSEDTAGSASREDQRCSGIRSSRTCCGRWWRATSRSARASQSVTSLASQGATREPAIWQEGTLMAAQQGQQKPLDFGPLADYLKKAGGFDQFVDSVGAEEFWAGLSEEKREQLRRLAQRDKPGDKGDSA